MLERVNPRTYQVDAIRSLMGVGAASEHGMFVDAAVLAAGLVLLVAVAARLYPRLGY